MSSIRHYGPSVVLIVTIVAVLLGGPTVMRQLAHADEQARIAVVANELQQSQLAEMSRAFQLVGQRVEPSVVHISVKRNVASRPSGREGMRQMPEDLLRRFFPDRFRDDAPQRDRRAPREEQREDEENLDQYNEPRQIGSGSGWVYDKKGHIVTNYHVVRNADVIEVKFADKSTRTAKVVGSDEKTDIAVLEVADERLHPAVLSLKSVNQGEIVFAFGSPFQFEFSMSQGIVSGKGRRLGILDKFDRYGNRIVAGYENFIQTDAAINPGNSGGPLTNIQGEVIGMNTAIATKDGASNGIGFAIPADMIRMVVDQIIDKGRVSRGYLGVWIKDMDPRMAATFGFEGKGVLVDRMAGPESPAAKAGLEPGDIITHIEGKEVDSSAALRRAVAVVQPGNSIKVKIFREGKTKTLKATLAEQPDDLSDMGDGSGIEPEEKIDDTAMAPLRKLGIEEVGSVPSSVAERLELKKDEGVLVESVRRNSVAAYQGLRPGSVIIKVMGKKVNSPAELVEAVADLDLQKGIRVRVAEEDSERFVLLALPEE